MKNLFPNIIKSVPSMIVGNEIWNGEVILLELEKVLNNSQYQESLNQLIHNKQDSQINN